MAVDLQRLNVKLYLEPGSSLPPEEAFRVFSQWIPESRDEVLIDVADYGHIDRGPRPCSSATTPTTSSTTPMAASVCSTAARRRRTVRPGSGSGKPSPPP